MEGGISVPTRGLAGVTFSIDRYIDLSLQVLIMRLLPLATNYSNFLSWCEEIYRMDWLVNQALSATFELLLTLHQQ